MKKSKKWLWISLVVVGVIIIILLLAVFTGRTRTFQQPTQQQSYCGDYTCNSNEMCAWDVLSDSWTNYNNLKSCESDCGVCEATDSDHSLAGDINCPSTQDCILNFKQKHPEIKKFTCEVNIAARYIDNTCNANCVCRW